MSRNQDEERKDEETEAYNTVLNTTMEGFVGAVAKVESALIAEGVPAIRALGVQEIVTELVRNAVQEAFGIGVFFGRNESELTAEIESTKAEETAK